MIKVQDILSLTEFHRNTKRHMTRLHATGRPELLTVIGKAKLVVQDAAAYQRVLDRIALSGESNRTTKSRRNTNDRSPDQVMAK
jgi:hypothetical protein